MKRRFTRSKATWVVDEEEEPEVLSSIDDINPKVKNTSNYNQPKRPKMKVDEKPYKTIKISTIHNSLEHATKKPDGFYLGTYPLKFRQISKIESITEDAISGIENVNIYEKRFKKINIRQIVAPSTFYLDFNQDTNEGDEDSLNSEIEIDYFFKCLIDLNAKKCIFFVKNQLDLETSSINIDIYLTSVLKLNLNEHSPSEIFKSKNFKSIHSLINFFYNDPVLFNQENESFADDNDSMTNDADDDDKKPESLFDLIYHEHQKKLKDDNSRIKFDSYLASILRPYQINAIKWMLKRELNNQLEDNSGTLHSLYHRITNKFNQVIYYHKFTGHFTDTMPSTVPSLPGGILADDMGLGKTLEVLGCILMNPRRDIPQHQIKIDESQVVVQKTNFSCVCGNVPRDISNNSEKAYSCRSCNVWTHIKCVNYSGPENAFLCPRCCTLQKPISSGCTLIVTPSVISHQWIDEIKKHIPNKDLNVLLYRGCTFHGFLQPRDLANLDICITTYDVLSNELNHVQSMEILPNLRQTKRFMKVPSPLICVEWWRICLDEAQMVHSTNAKCADMASRLYAVNRWCVTGTPIGRSLSDLHGLFSFIREDPYYEKRWFNELLYCPFKSGDKKPMVDSLSNVLWRTTKRFVLDQIDIPNQVEQIHWLKFTPFEKHLYERILEYFRQSRQDRSNEHLFDALEDNSRLDELDRDTLNRLLQPLIDLRLTCNHPQLILKKRAFFSHNNFKKEKILTMEKSLQILTKKTKTECEEKYRGFVMFLNALAALHIIEENYDAAIEIYRQILASEKEYENKLSIDRLQKIHTIHNLNEVLVLHKNEAEDEILKKQQDDCEKSYMSSFDASKYSHQEKLKKKMEDIDEKLDENHHEFETWWVILLNKLVEGNKSKEFLERLSMEISLNYNTGLNDNILVVHTICGKSFTTIDGLKKICVNELEKFSTTRHQLLENLDRFFNNIDKALITNATSCHLRPTDFPKNKNKCELCKADGSFRQYAKYLFSHSDEILKFTEDQMKKANGEGEEEDEESLNTNENFLTDDNLIENLNRDKSSAVERKFYRSTTDLEKLFKLLCSMFRSDDKLSEYVKIGKSVLELYEAYKEEFKLCRQFWLSASYQINAYDELEMAKIRMRLRELDEELTDAKEANYILERAHVPMHRMKANNDKVVVEMQLRKKLGQFLYLQNLSKTYELDNNQVNEEVCPICQHNLEAEWYVLVCGHCYCVECLKALIKSESEGVCNCQNCVARQQREHSNSKNVRCALCREISKGDETYLVRAGRSLPQQPSAISDSNRPCTSANAESSGVASNSIQDTKINADDENFDEFENISIKGKSNSTKVEGVVKCLLKILKDDSNAKCLVFSYWATMLDLIQDSLKENYIEYRCLKENGSAQKNLLEFKNTENGVSVLLVPFNFGASGLNLIEATHILLVEPILNISQEVQAIGRIHRIGQTKKTFIHRFLVRNTIEELIFNLFIGNSSYDRVNSSNKSSSNSNRKIITISDLRDLFLKL